MNIDYSKIGLKIGLENKVKTQHRLTALRVAFWEQPNVSVTVSVPDRLSPSDYTT